MYCPYLRGKQFELLALREFSSCFTNNDKILPIIEPVKKQVNNLNQTATVMIENKMKFAIILNPKEGDFKYQSVDNDVLDSLTSLRGNRGNWIPAYIIHNNNEEKSLKHAENNNLTNLMVISPSGIDVNNNNLMELLSNERVTYIVFDNNRSSKNRLLKLGKALISLGDRFKGKPRNADYADEVDEIFSDDFAYYKNDGLTGFADYTPMTKNFIDGGMLPYAIAIHLTYQKSDDQIFVHHFVSDSNFDQSNIRGKFHEATTKIAPFYNKNGLYHTTAIEELIDKSMSEDGYPGLGYIKKLSIKNHLELINHILPE